MTWTSEWLADSLRTLLDSAPPSLVEICIINSLIVCWSLQPHVRLDTLEVLKSIIVESPSSPRLRLRFQFKGPEREQHLADLGELMRERIAARDREDSRPDPLVCGRPSLMAGAVAV